MRFRINRCRYDGVIMYFIVRQICNIIYVLYYKYIHKIVVKQSCNFKALSKVKLKQLYPKRFELYNFDTKDGY